MNNINKKVLELENTRVSLVFPLDETKKASYKITSHDELTY